MSWSRRPGTSFQPSRPHEMDAFRCLALTCLLVGCLFITAEAHFTACNQKNDTLCLEGNDSYEGVRMFLKNTNYFWFGDDYATNCPNDKHKPIHCMNLAPDYQSIITRMRMSHDNDTEGVMQVLNVHYMAPAGSFMGCGTRVEVPALNTTIDSVHSVHDNAWSLQHRPDVMWTSKTDAAYTLVFWDAGHFMLQGMWVNIKGGSLKDGQEVIPYAGPLNPYMRKNPYVLALYEQSTTLPDISAAFDFVRNLHMMDGHVKLNLLVDHMNLTGPVGIGLVTTEVDEYSAMMTGRGMHLVNYCPHLTTIALRQRTDVPFLNVSDTDFNLSVDELTVSVEVTYSPPEFSAMSCCQNHTVPKNTRHADSRFMAMVEPVFTRMTPHVRLVPTPLRDDPYYFAHRMFTLLFVDVTEEMTNSSQSNYYLHWQVINIRDPMLQTGNTTMGYLGSMVTFSAKYPKRIYAYLLYEQRGLLTSDQVGSNFSGAACPMPIEGRCSFNLRKFQKDLNLTPVGASGHISAPDGWSRLQGHMKLGMPKSSACLDVKDYSDPCPKIPECTSGVTSLPPLNMAALVVVSVLVSLSVF
ncbi:uncharacterized protein [Littorina saxatilis]|uniref:Uncharacterized protein n=2 Tax=Littorina saxatilis TaxID=31220 RepID=A0AAN9B6E7_9CAEN